MKGRVYAWLTALTAAVVLGCTGCGITAADPADSRKGEDDSLIKEQAVTSREQAREIMGKYLEEKYGLSYEVQLPHRNDTGDFQAQAYPGEDVNRGVILARELFEIDAFEAKLAVLFGEAAILVDQIAAEGFNRLDDFFVAHGNSV